MARILAILSLIVALSACQVLGGSEPASSDKNTSQSNEAIQWDSGPYNVVFRAEVLGGENADAIYTKNEISYCTIYGDGHVIWTAGAFDGGDVIFDRLTDQQIRDFVGYLTIQERFYTYRSRADLEISQVAPVVETLTLKVNDVEHKSDALGGWPENYFSRIVQACQQLGAAPTVYEPEGAWLTVGGTLYDSSIPSVLWDPEASGLNFQQIANSGEKVWIEGRNTKVLWASLRAASPDTQFSDPNGDYFIALEVPGVTKDAPPPP